MSCVSWAGARCTRSNHTSPPLPHTPVKRFQFNRRCVVCSLTRGCHAWFKRSFLRSVMGSPSDRESSYGTPRTSRASHFQVIPTTAHQHRAPCRTQKDVRAVGLVRSVPYCTVRSNEYSRSVQCRGLTSQKHYFACGHVDKMLRHIPTREKRTFPSFDFKIVPPGWRLMNFSTL